MKHLKMLGLLALATASLTAFVGSASAAPVITSPPGTEYTGETHLTLRPGTSITVKAGIEDTCTTATKKAIWVLNDSFEGKWQDNGVSYGSPATPCAKHTSVLKAGSGQVSDSGTVTTFNDETTINDTALGISCVYGGGSGGTVLGTLTGGTPAKLTVNTTKLKKISGGFFCAAEGTMTAEWVITSPGSLFIT
ncbi:MAG: hypothetical protein ACTHNY_01385 [Solirubrobacterales bacterium]